MGRKKKGDMSPRRVRVSYTIDPNLVSQIVAIAEGHSQSVSSVIEEAVVHFIDAWNQANPQRSVLKRPPIEEVTA